MAGKVGFDALWDSDGSHFLGMETLRGGTDTAPISLFERKNPRNNVVFSFKTFPEKCVFSRLDKNKLFCAIPTSLGSRPLPDAWWQGKTQFSDILLEINTKTGTSSQLLENMNFDIVSPFLSNTEDYFFFTDKKDSTLWSLRLTAASSTPQ